jgi:hypothetical protein
MRAEHVQLIPPGKDELLRTIYVGGITAGSGGDEGIEKILNAAGRLKKWQRAMDADNKPCRFGFAEYEDSDSLSTAVDLLKGVEVPINKPRQKEDEINGDRDENETEGDEELKKTKLLVSVEILVPCSSPDHCPRSSSMTRPWIIFKDTKPINHTAIPFKHNCGWTRRGKR